MNGPVVKEDRKKVTKGRLQIGWKRTLSGQKGVIEVNICGHERVVNYLLGCSICFKCFYCNVDKDAKFGDYRIDSFRVISNVSVNCSEEVN